MPSKDFAARRNPAIAGCTATGVLKILALVFMFIDHAGKMLFPQITEMRMLGRILDYHIKCNTAPKKERHCVRFVLE